MWVLEGRGGVALSRFKRSSACACAVEKRSKPARIESRMWPNFDKDSALPASELLLLPAS